MSRRYECLVAAQLQHHRQAKVCTMMMLIWNALETDALFITACIAPG